MSKISHTTLKDLDIKMSSKVFKSKHNLWLFTRIYYWTRIDQGKINSSEIFNKNRKQLLISFFIGWYNWFLLPFKNYWFFSNSLERRNINGIDIDKSMETLRSKLKSSFTFELPLPSLSKNIPKTTRVSMIPLKIIELIIAKYFTKIDKNDLKQLQDLVYDSSLETNLKKAISQYKTVKFLLLIKKPKAVFITVSYNKHPNIKAFKEAGVKVIEIQHGLISNEHIGYNLFGDIHSHYLPDYLLSFGDTEHQILQKSGSNFSQVKTKPMGSFILDHYADKQIEKRKDKVQIAVSLQSSISGDKLIPFLTQIAKKRKDIEFQLSTREPYKYVSIDLPENMILNQSLSIYELICQSHIHCSIYSTCLLEAPYLGVPNLIIDIDNMYSMHFQKETLDNVSEEINSTDHFDKAIDNLLTLKKVQSSYFYKSYEKNIENFVQSELLELNE